MKLSLVAACCLFAGVSFAQSPDASPSATPEPAGYKKAKLLKKEAVGYPIAAQVNRMTGVVHAKFSIDDEGHVTDVKALRSGGSVLLDDMVREKSLRQWQFEPATLNGKPIASNYETEFEFQLDPNQQREIAGRRLALPIGKPQPPYPTEALEKKSAGTATFDVQWTKGDHAGLMDHIYLLTSSGSGFLDARAMQWVYENWRIDPSEVPEKGSQKLAVTFTPPK